MPYPLRRGHSETTNLERIVGPPLRLNDRPGHTENARSFLPHHIGRLIEVLEVGNILKSIFLNLH